MEQDPTHRTNRKQLNDGLRFVKIFTADAERMISEIQAGLDQHVTSKTAVALKLGDMLDGMDNAKLLSKAFPDEQVQKVLLDYYDRIETRIYDFADEQGVTIRRTTGYDRGTGRSL